MQSVVETIVQCSEELQTQRNTINILNNQVAIDNNDFSNIYDAIVAKGQTPTKSDRDTYAPAILAIDGGGSTPVLQDKTVSPSMEEQVVNADTGYDGLRNVTVEAVMLQNKTVRASQDAQYINADDGYDGLGTVTIEGVDHTVDSDIRSENIKAGVDILGVIGNYSGEGATYQSKEVDPTTSEQNISADVGYDALSNVKVKAVTAAIDSNIVASNIKKDVEILGVTGTLEEGGNFKGWIKEGELLATSPVTTQCRSLVVNDEGIFIVGNKYLYKYDEVTDTYTLVNESNLFRPLNSDAQANVINFASGNKNRIYGVYKDSNDGNKGLIWSYDDLHGLVGNENLQIIQGYMSDAVCNDNSMYMYDINNKYLRRYDIIANDHTTVEQVMQSNLDNTNYRPLEIFNGDVYTFDKTKLYRFNLSNNTFEEVGDIPDFTSEVDKVSYASILAFDNKLYILGGKEPYDTYVRVYDGTTINSLGSKIPSCISSRVKYYNGDVYMLGSGTNYTLLYKIYTSGKVLNIKPSNENVTYKDDIGFNIVNVKAVKSVGHCTPKHKDAAPEKNYRRVTTFNNVDNRRAIYFKDQVHVFLDKKHWIFDEETESLINEETVAALDGAMDWNYMPVIDDAGEYMYLMSYANWSGFGYLVRYDGTTFERIGAQDKPLGEILYKDGLIYVNKGSNYYTIDVTDGTKGADTSKDSSISWMYSFVKDGKIYNVATGAKDVYEIDIATMTQSVVMTLPYDSFKSTFYIDNKKEWIYTTLGPLNNDHLIRFKITGEVEEIGTGYSIGTNYGGRFMCTIVTDKKVWLLWYFMEQMAVLSIGKNVIAVPRDATRLYEGCTESDVKVTESGDLAILEIPEDANYLVYDDNNIYAYNVVNDQILTAEGLKLNGNNVHGGLVNVSSYDYYIMER